jgi:hypothetical protein
MHRCPGEGCDFKVKDDRSLGVHLRTCRKAAVGLTLVSEEIQQREVERREAKRRRILSPEHPEAPPRFEDPMDIDLKVI